MAVVRGGQNVTYDRLWRDIKEAFADVWGKKIGAGPEYGKLLKEDPSRLAKYFDMYAKKIEEIEWDTSST